MPVFQPIGQKRLTNIAVVRLKKGGHRFEVACFPNKVLNWRNGVEKDLDEVLQSRQIFANVSKGVLAKGDDLLAAFNTEDEDKICVEVLSRGDYQVSDKERHLQIDSLFHEIATIVADKCVDATTGRPLTVSLIERGMQTLHYSVSTTRTAKQQALDVIKLLEQSDMGIMRAQMRLRVRAAADMESELRALLEQLEGTKLEREEKVSGTCEIVCLVNPGSFRELSNPANSSIAGLTVEVLDAKAVRMDADAAHGGSSSAPAGGAVDTSAGAAVDKPGASTGADGSASEALPPSRKLPAAVAGAEGARSGAGDATTAAAAERTFACKSCPGAQFADAHAHREHFKSEWHKFNLSRKTRGAAPLSEEEFAEAEEELKAAGAGGGDDDFFK